MSEGLVELTVHDIAAGGDGVARLDSGRVVFVPRTAPGDRVVARLTENRARWSRGRLVHVRSGGAGRVDPVCRHFHACGGCGLQHLDTDTQIRALERGVTETLARIGGARIPIRPIRPARARLGYRNRVTFTLRRSGGRAIAGYHRLTGPRLLDVDTCPLAE
ncbi:MAG: TRAM domain-containing protein, partial [Gemmatimonadetes bacterium]|nr:TRAM domain-containing protein [Gemmatimonadota bacterium]